MVLCKNKKKPRSVKNWKGKSKEELLLKSYRKDWDKRIKVKIVRRKVRNQKKV